MIAILDKINRIARRDKGRTNPRLTLRNAYLCRDLLGREELPKRRTLELDVVIPVDYHVIRHLLDLFLHLVALPPDEALHAVERVLGVDHRLCIGRKLLGATIEREQMKTKYVASFEF